VGLVDAIIAAKCRRIEVSRAMQEPLADIRAVPLVKAASNRRRRSSPISWRVVATPISTTSAIWLT
jgi:CMP-2-keto-3-deoxyoctulosonic acid synthetase